MALYSTVPPFQNPEIPTDMPSGAKHKKQDTGLQINYYWKLLRMLCSFHSPLRYFYWSVSNRLESTDEKTNLFSLNVTSHSSGFPNSAAILGYLALSKPYINYNRHLAQITMKFTMFHDSIIFLSRNPT